MGEVVEVTPEEKAVIDAAIAWSRTESVREIEDAGEVLQDAVEALLAARKGYENVKPMPRLNTFRQDARMGRAAGSFPCWECIDPGEDPRSWCDCQQNEPASVMHLAVSGPCRFRAHAPERCPLRPRSMEITDRGAEPTVPERPTEEEYASLPLLEVERIKTGPTTETHIISGVPYAEITAYPPESTWRPATFLYCLAGDRIRIGQDESDVLRSSSGAWHANVVSSVMPSGKTWDKVTPWEHTGLRLDLSANPGFREYPPNTPCEILCTPERLAILTLMQAFPGSEKIS